MRYIRPAIWIFIYLLQLFYGNCHIFLPISSGNSRDIDRNFAYNNWAQVEANRLVLDDSNMFYRAEHVGLTPSVGNGTRLFFVSDVCKNLLQNYASSEYEDDSRGYDSSNYATEKPFYVMFGGRILPLQYRVVYQQESQKKEFSWRRKLQCAVSIRPAQDKISPFRPYVDLVVHRRDEFRTLFHDAQHQILLRVRVHATCASCGAHVSSVCILKAETCLIRQIIPFEWFRIDYDTENSARSILNLAYTVDIESENNDKHIDNDADIVEFIDIEPRIELDIAVLNPDLVYNNDVKDTPKANKMTLYTTVSGDTISSQSIISNTTLTINSLNSIFLFYRNNAQLNELLNNSISNRNLTSAKESSINIQIEIDSEHFIVETIQSIGSNRWSTQIEKIHQSHATTITIYVVSISSAQMDYSIENNAEYCFLAVLLRCKTGNISESKLPSEELGTVRFIIDEDSNNEQVQFQLSNATTYSNYRTEKSGNLGNKSMHLLRYSISTNDFDYDIVPILKHPELINTAVLSGKQVAESLRVFSVSAHGFVRDVTAAAHCISDEPRVFKASPTCASVYVDGSERRGAARAIVRVQYANLRTILTVRVWFPRLPLVLRVDDPVLNRIENWRVPIKPTKVPYSKSKASDDSKRKGILNENLENFKKRFRNYSSVDNMSSKNSCIERFQQTEIRVLASFHVIEELTGESSFLGDDEDLLLDVSRLVHSRVHSSNADAIYVRWELDKLLASVRNPGSAKISVQCLVHPQLESQSNSDKFVFDCGSAPIFASFDPIHATILRVTPATQARAEFCLSDSSSSLFNALAKVTIKARHDFFQQFQYGFLDIGVEYSDGHMELLADIPTNDYLLRVYSAHGDALRVLKHRERRTHRQQRGASFQGGVELIAIRELTIADENDKGILGVRLHETDYCSSNNDRAIAIGQAMVLTSFETIEESTFNDSRGGFRPFDDVDSHAHYESKFRRRNLSRIAILILVAISTVMIITIIILMVIHNPSSKVNPPSGSLFYAKNWASIKEESHEINVRNHQRHDYSSKEETTFLDKGAWSSRSFNWCASSDVGRRMRWLFKYSRNAGKRPTTVDGYNKLIGQITNTSSSSPSSEISGLIQRSPDGFSAHNSNSLISFEARWPSFQTRRKKRCITETKSFGDVAVAVETARDSFSAAMAAAASNRKWRAGSGRRVRANWIWLPSDVREHGANANENLRLPQNTSASIENEYSRRSTLELNSAPPISAIVSHDSSGCYSTESRSSSSSSCQDKTKNVIVSYYGSEISICIGGQSSNVTVNNEKAQKRVFSSADSQCSHGGQLLPRMAAVTRLRDCGVQIQQQRPKSYNGTQYSIEDNGNFKRKSDEYSGKRDDQYDNSYKSINDYGIEYRKAPYTVPIGEQSERDTQLYYDYEAVAMQQNMREYYVPKDKTQSHSGNKTRQKSPKKKRKQSVKEKCPSNHYTDDLCAMPIFKPTLNVYRAPRTFEYSLPLPTRVPEVLPYQPNSDDFNFHYGKRIRFDEKIDEFDGPIEFLNHDSTSDTNLNNGYIWSQRDSSQESVGRNLYDKVENQSRESQKAAPRQFSPPLLSIGHRASRLTLLASSIENLDTCLNGTLNSSKISYRSPIQPSNKIASRITAASRQAIGISFCDNEKDINRCTAQEHNSIRDIDIRDAEDFDNTFSSNNSTLKETFT